MMWMLIDDDKESSMIELEPCPFCKSVSVSIVEELSGKPYGVYCKSCGAITQFTQTPKDNGVAFDDVRECIAWQWNVREKRE